MTYSQAFLDEHRDINVDHDWWDSVYEDFLRVCELLGVDVEHTPRRAYRGAGREVTVRDPCIYFSGFCSQGDGASFSGDYSTVRYDREAGKLVYVADAAPVAIREYAPNDTKLHDIADDLCLMRRIYGDVGVKITKRGHYFHAYTMDIGSVEFNDVEDGDDDVPAEIVDVVEATIRDNMRALADWLYDQLETEYDHLTSDEVVAETLEANEIEEEIAA
jgi:hypothetical protein